MQLSKRLSTVAGMVTPGCRLADIGTDHGYIPIYLAEQKHISYAYACDINEGPIKRAKENIEAHGLSAYIETRQSDGVGGLKENETDCVVIAGMGGGLVIKILTQGEKILRTVKELILSPQSEIEEVRRFLKENHYLITDETMLLDDGKYYTIMKVIHGEMTLVRKIDLKYGRNLISKKDSCLLSFLEKEENAYKKILSQMAGVETAHSKKRVEEIMYELDCIRQAKEEITK